MTEYTDDADKAIREAPRTVQAGDLVSHVDDPLRSLGRVYVVDDDGTASVQIPGQRVQHGIPVDRLTFVERPEAFASIEFNGHDEIDDTEISYAFVIVDTPEQIMRDVETFGRTEGYTVVNSHVPEPETED